MQDPPMNEHDPITETSSLPTSASAKRKDYVTGLGPDSGVMWCGEAATHRACAVAGKHR